ncbi:MATE family efflux transporter, partial [Clostridium sp.]
GIQPLLGYCVGSKNWKRYKESLRFSVIFGLGLSTFMTIICYVFDRQIVGVFLSDPEAFGYGVEFSRILLTTSFLFGMFYVLSNALQAMGAATSALIINMSRQGLIYIPAIFILQSIIGMDGLLWAQPVADILSVVLVVILYRVTLKNKIYTQEPKSV